MRKLSALLLVTVLFLTGCSIDWNNEKERKIGELEKQVMELKNATSTGMVLFERNTKCGTLTPDIQARIDSMNKEYANLGKFSIGGIFYSPVKDACLWTRLTNTYAPDGSPMERRALYQFGDDFGAAEPIIGCEKVLGDKLGINTCASWDTEIKRLKWETTEGILAP